MKTPKYTPLQWETDYDKYDNTIWTASSFVCVEVGSPCYYKIVPKLRGDKVVWFDKSDSELGRENDPWESLEEAKKALEANEREMWDGCVSDGTLESLEEDEE